MANEVLIGTTEIPGVRIIKHDDHMPPQPAFVMGMIFGALMFWLIQSWRRRGQDLKASRAGADDRRYNESSEIAALARRTAALETIVTDPAQRVSREIANL